MRGSLDGVGRLENRAQAEAAVQELRTVRQALERIEAVCEARVAHARAVCSLRSLPLAGRAAGLERMLETWAGQLLGECPGTLDLRAGTLYQQCSVELNTALGQTWGGVVARLKAMGRQEALVVMERPNPAVLAAWGEGELAGIGVLKSAARRFVVATKPAPSNAVPHPVETSTWAQEGLPAS